MFLILIVYYIKTKAVASLENHAFAHACVNMQLCGIQSWFPSLNNLKTRCISVSLGEDIYSSILICSVGE